MDAFQRPVTGTGLSVGRAANRATSSVYGLVLLPSSCTRTTFFTGFQDSIGTQFLYFTPRFAPCTPSMLRTCTCLVTLISCAT